MFNGSDGERARRSMRKYGGRTGGRGQGSWLDKNTPINLRASGDQCRNAFLIGFDGVCEAAAWSLELRAGSSPRRLGSARPGELISTDLSNTAQGLVLHGDFKYVIKQGLG